MSDPNLPPQGPQGTPPPPQWGQQPPPPGPPQHQGGPQPPPQAPPPQQQWGQQPPPGPPQQQWGQQPPPQAPPPQQQWGPQPGSPQPYQPQQGQSSGGGLEPNIGAMLAYLLFGWIGGLIMYFTQKNPEVRFHGAQSVLLFGALFVLQVMISFVFGGLFGFGLNSLISLASFGMWIFMSIQGYQLNHLKLPVIGDIAEQWAAKPA